MNIFFTSTDPVQCAREHCDRHLVKMILEQAQLLSTAHVLCDKNQVAYKKTHENHPCAVWIRKDKNNYLWGADLLKALLTEYSYRTGKVHKTSEHLPALLVPPENIADTWGMTTFMPKCMPDQFKSKHITVAYQNYLNSKFSEWLSRDRPLKVEWTNRETPAWVSI